MTRESKEDRPVTPSIEEPGLVADSFGGFEGLREISAWVSCTQLKVASVHF